MQNVIALQPTLPSQTVTPWPQTETAFRGLIGISANVPTSRKTRKGSGNYCPAAIVDGELVVWRVGQA